VLGGVLNLFPVAAVGFAPHLNPTRRGEGAQGSRFVWSKLIYVHAYAYAYADVHAR
jgi:hypothetical protein